MLDSGSTLGSDFLEGGGEMGALIRVHDWIGTRLGPISDWPQSLRTTVSLMLRSPVPMVLLWGPHGVMIYNDAYTVFAAGRHPRVLGAGVLEGWPEVAEFNANVMRVGLSGGTLSYRDQELTLHRNSVPEQVWMNLDYSPVLDESGRPGGVLAIVVETTERVLAEQRTAQEGERLREMFEQAPGIMAMFRGPDHVYEMANAAHLDHIGHRDLIGKTVREALPELAGQGIVELLDEVYATGTPYVGHQRAVSLQRQAGAPRETRYVDFVFQPIRDARGRVMGIFVQGHDVTEHVRSQLALRESEAHLTAVFAQAAAGLVECDLSGRFLRVNDRFCTIVGHTREELLGGLRMQDLTHPEDLPANLREFQRVPETGEAFEIEKRYLRPDGQTVWVRNAVSPVYDDAGRPRTMVAVCIDLTRKKRIDAARQESEARLASIFDQAAAGLSEVSLDGHFLRVNDELCRLLGRSREELLGLGILDVTAAADIPPSRRAVAEALETGGPVSLDKRYLRPDGTLVWANSSITRLSRAEGQSETLLAVTVDLTARHEAEVALRASEARLRLALDAGRMAVWQSDTRTNTITISPELNLLLGFPADAAPSTEDIRSRYAPGAREGLRAAAAAALARGDRNAEGELEVIWPDGSHHWLLVRAELEVKAAADGAPQIKATGIAFDITERKRWEEHQRLLINELNHRVKNTLATVQAMAAQSLRQLGEESRPKLQSFEDRLFALARAHDVLTRENWEGAEIRQIIDEVVEPYARGNPGRFGIEGPRLRLSPPQALTIAMAVHELATNAAKYGALSIPAGSVTIVWAVTLDSMPRVALRWQESNGPPVAPPTRRGFGTRLIERGLAQDLGGSVRLSYEPAGIVCTMNVPLNAADGKAGTDPS
ncbi:PAS domain S-box protein [Microvirga terrae]|uniref:Blue-light-activated histidine kinase n=1 Tax=Microvirga terrae TaxID=2740529 RepID=A0ABY5RWG9_9HYPH|nr:PAS domain S-box protein [Microvirga terrae]UVF21605.1 PAS domain S-box protein [Microvirga terrae]